MQKLIAAVLAALSIQARNLYDADKVDQVIREHQNQWPSDWATWNFEGRVKHLAAGLNRAAKKRETMAARILQEGF